MIIDQLFTPKKLTESTQDVSEATYSKREKAQVMIYKYFGQIYDYGDDDGLNYLDEQGELWNQLMDKYNGEIEDIVAREPTEVLMQAAQELKVIADEMEFDLDEAGVTEGEVTKNATGLKHRATDKYGAGDDEPHHYTGGRSGFSEPGKYARDLEHVNKQLVKDLDASMGISWKNRGPKGLEVDEQGVTEGEYDSRKPFGVRYKVFAGREGRMTTREYWTSSEEKLQRAVDKIQALDNFYEIDGYSYPKESQGVAEGGFPKKISQKEVDKFQKKHNDKLTGREVNRQEQEKKPADNTKKQGVAEGSEQKPAITYKDYTLQYDYQTEDDDPEGYSTATTYYFDVLKDGDRVGEAEYFDYFGNLTIRINGKTKEFGFRHPLASQISQLVSSLPDEQKKDLSDPRFESQGLTEVFADQGSGSTDRDNADYMKRRNAAKKAGYTGRETKAGTWRVFKDGNAVAAAGPFKSADEAAAWIKKHKQGITEMDKSEPSAGRDTGPREGPEKIAKPITKEKMVKHALDALSKSMVKKDDKKKDVKEGQEVGAQLRRDFYALNDIELRRKYGLSKDYIRQLLKISEVPTSPVELAITAPGVKMAKMAGQSAVAAAKNKLDSLRAQGIEHYDTAMRKGSARVHGGPPQFPSDAGVLMGDRAEWMRTVKSAPSEWDDTTGSIGMDPQMKSPFPPLMKKLQAAMVQEGRVKELADDLKTMPDADFMKKYGKAKAAIRRDMTKIDEARSDYTPDEMADMLSGKRSQKQIDADAERTRGPNKAPPTKESTQSRAKRLNEKLSTSDTLSRPAASASSSGKAIDDPDIMGSLKSASTPKFDRFSKTDSEPKIDFRAGLVGGEPEVEAEPRFMVDPLPDMQKWGGKFATGNAGGDNRFTAPAGWRYVEKDEDPARYGSAPAAAAAGGGLPDLKYDPQSRTLKSADALALDLSPKSKFKFDRATQSQVSVDGSGANPNIDNATRDRARAYAARQNAPVDAAKKVDWRTIYALNKATIGSNPNIIKPRMQLNMPNGTIYLVQPGDTLTKIAAKQNQVNELSTEKLAQYKTAAARDARQADQEGDVKRGDKRFGGIVKATKKQFDNDAKKVDESRAARRALMARIVNSG